MDTCVIATPLGNIELSLANQCLLGLSFTEQPCFPPSRAPQWQIIIDQLNRYFDNAEHSFDVPFTLAGTSFQQRVWQALRAIPTGTTLTYGELANNLNTSPRAIGNACRANPIPIIIPCHRVVGQRGLTGFAGDTQGRLLDIKAFLLNHEMAIYSDPKRAYNLPHQHNDG